MIFETWTIFNNLVSNNIYQNLQKINQKNNILLKR